MTLEIIFDNYYLLQRGVDRLVFLVKDAVDDYLENITISDKVNMCLAYLLALERGFILDCPMDDLVKWLAQSTTYENFSTAIDIGLQKCRVGMDFTHTLTFLVKIKYALFLFKQSDYVKYSTVKQKIRDAITEYRFCDNFTYSSIACNFRAKQIKKSSIREVSDVLKANPTAFQDLDVDEFDYILRLALSNFNAVKEAK